MQLIAFLVVCLMTCACEAGLRVTSQEVKPKLVEPAEVSAIDQLDQHQRRLILFERYEHHIKQANELRVALEKEGCEVSPLLWRKTVFSCKLDTEKEP